MKEFHVNINEFKQATWLGVEAGSDDDRHLASRIAGVSLTAIRSSVSISEGQEGTGRLTKKPHRLSFPFQHL